MRSSRHKLDLSARNSPSVSQQVSENDGLTLQTEVNEKLDILIGGSSSADLDKLKVELMKILNAAIRNTANKNLTRKVQELKKNEKDGDADRTTKTTSTHTLPSRRMHGVMRGNTDSDDRSIAQTYSHIQARESNEILEDVLRALPVLDEDGKPHSRSPFPIRKGRMRGGSFIPVKPQPDVEVEQSKRNIFSLFFGKSSGAIYTRTLAFADADFQTKQIKSDYFSFKSSDLNFPMVTLVFFFGCTIFLLRFDFDSNWVQLYNSPCYTVSFTFALLAVISMVIIVFNRLTLLSFRYNIHCLQRFHKSMISLMKTRYGQFADDGVLLFGTISAATYLLAIVVQESSCEATEHLLSISVPCGTWKENGIVPAEHLILNMLIVLFVQGFANSASRHAVVLGWIISITCSNLSISYIGSHLYFWINVQYLMLLCVSYEFERHTLRHFVKSMLAVDISESNSCLSLALANQRITEGEVALSSKRSVVRHVTHEVRTPLNTVAIGADVLTHELKQLGEIIPPLLMEVVVGIREASAAALEVVNELLAFEKISAGLFTIEPVQTSLLTFLRKCMSQHFIPALAKDITLEMSQVDYAEIMVSIDPTKMGIVIRNVLANAIKFSHAGGTVTVGVDVKGFEEGGMVVISVRDSGAGLSPANISRLFQEGVQFDANRLQDGGGSGFGLYISKAIMELHEDGCIWAESDGEGLGCTFRMELTPLALDMTANTDSAHQSDAAILIVDVHTIVPMRVLVVDDSEANRKMMIRMLRTDHHICLQAEDGLAAVSEIARSLMRRSPVVDPDSPPTLTRSLSLSHSPCDSSFASALNNLTLSTFDIVLMDSSMPVMSGPDAAREMRRSGYTGPIIGVTGDADTSEFLAAGADLVLMKPVNRLRLTDAIVEAQRKRILANTLIFQANLENMNRSKACRDELKSSDSGMSIGSPKVQCRRSAGLISMEIINEKNKSNSPGFHLGDMPQRLSQIFNWKGQNTGNKN